jgi:hypothetical protein
MPTPIATESVTLKGGHVVSLDALRLLWALEEDGLNVERDGDQLTVGPKSKVRAEYRPAIRQHRDELLMLVDYCEATTLCHGVM